MKKLTHEEFLKVLNRTDIAITGIYNGWRNHIGVKCNICEYEWSPTACNLINGSGCPVCANKKRKDSQIWEHDKFVESLQKINSHIHPTEQYNGYNIYINFKCDICKNEWLMTPHEALGKIPCGCPRCSHEKRKATFNKRYGGDTPFASQLIRDKAAISNINNPRTIKSTGEKQIKNWLDSHHIKYEYEAVFDDCRDLRMLPFDFKILNEDESIHCLIEYDGEQHTRGWDGEEGSLEIIQRHDNIKTQYCSDRGLKLIRISHLQNPIEILSTELKEYGV